MRQPRLTGVHEVHICKTSSEHRAETVDPERLTEQVRQLQKVAAIGRLAPGIAHDFNNVLTVIIGYADLVTTALGTTGDARADVQEIRRAAERAAGLTQQILSFTRHESGQIGPVDVNAVVADMSRMLKRMVGDDIEVVVNSGSLPCTVCSDVSHVQQVLMNLVVNARDAMPHGGRLSIATSRLTVDGVRWSSHPEVPPGEYVVLEVADEGVGMTEDVRARLFEPFFTTKGPDQGTGLGLSIVARIVRDSGGQIVVDTAPGCGTRFSVFLPVATDAQLEETVPAFDRRRLDGCGTVLLVEDEPQVRAVAASWLRRYGYAVHEAAGGEAAIALVKNSSLMPDLLVTDLVMPGIGGTRLAALMQPAFSEMKVLYLSGYPMGREFEGQLGQRGVAFVQKPFSPARLLNAVRSLTLWPGPDRRGASAGRALPPAQFGAA